MFCQKCYQFTECEENEAQSENVYFEYPYFNAYARKRKCSGCGKKFKTYEIGEKTLLTLRKIVLATEKFSKKVSEIYQGWAESKEDFFNSRNQGSENVNNKTESEEDTNLCTQSKLNISHGTENAIIDLAICPACNGEGGKRGGCYKCDGSGWVNQETVNQYKNNRSLDPFPYKNNHTSSTNYISSAGVVYRDRDGSFGSSPLSDNYDEESNGD